MMHRMKRATSWLLLLALLLGTVGCGAQPTTTEPPASSEQVQTTEPVQTAPSVTDPAVTDPSVTDPSVTDPSVTDPTVTEPSVTDPSVTDPSVTDPTGTVPVVTDPTTTVPVPTTPEPTVPAPTDPTVTQPKPTEPAPTDPDEALIDVDTDKLPVSQQTLYDRLFAPDRKIQVDIRISDSELLKLQKDYEHYSGFGSKSPIYRMADVVITIDGVGYLIREVGVRMKGNTSRIDFYDPQQGIYDLIHLKLDFQETFDDEDYYGDQAKKWSSKDQRKARKDRTFATLENLELRWNKCGDTTYIREIYSYDLYRSEGVLAPKAHLCSLDMAGVHMGLYTMVEPVDEIFLQKRLSARDLGGDLYKCSRKSSFTQIRSIGIENEDLGKFYCYDLKTNKKTSQHSALGGLIAQLNCRVVTRESLAQAMDMEYFLSYAAVSHFLGNSDDLRNNYNNFYIYFLKSSGKAIIIPYDLDQCLGATSGMRLADDDPFSSLQEGLMEPLLQENPMFRYTVVRGGLYVEDLAAALVRVSKNKLLSPDTFDHRFEQAKKLYGGDAIPGKSFKSMAGRDPAMAQSDPSNPKQKTTFRNYMEAMQASVASFLAKGYEDDGFSVPVPTDFCVSGTMNGWDKTGTHMMEWKDGAYTFDLTLTKASNVKIYHKPSGVWLDDRYLRNAGQGQNISLKEGTYHIVYDPYTMTITVT